MGSISGKRLQRSGGTPGSRPLTSETRQSSLLADIKWKPFFGSFGNLSSSGQRHWDMEDSWASLWQALHRKEKSVSFLIPVKPLD